VTDLADFPFPLTADSYQYTANLQPAGQRQVTEAGSWGETVTRAGPDYDELIAERERILRADPGRLIRDPALPAAEWDTLRYLMRHLVADHPGSFEYSEDGAAAHWANRHLGAAADWMPAGARFIAAATADDIAREVYLRVELQHLIRLETSGAILFLIDTRLLSVGEVARVPAWAARLTAVLTSLPDDVADYKGLAELRPRVVDCLRRPSAHT
jgi:hypothetical protein